MLLRVNKDKDPPALHPEPKQLQEAMELRAVLAHFNMLD
jgi:hypothetical protein